MRPQNLSSTNLNVSSKLLQKNFVCQSGRVVLGLKSEIYLIIITYTDKIKKIYSISCEETNQKSYQANSKCKRICLLLIYFLLNISFYELFMKYVCLVITLKEKRIKFTGRCSTLVCTDCRLYTKLTQSGNLAQ